MVRRTLFLFLVSLILPPLSHAEMVRRPVAYSVGDLPCSGLLVLDTAAGRPLPGLVFVPNWMGMTEGSFRKAEKVAAMGYVVFVADLYGEAVRPESPEQAREASAVVKEDRTVMRERVNAALDVLIKTVDAGSLDASRLGAIGFCLGGTAVLELARSGRDIDGVVSFHGNLDSPTPATKGEVTASVLVLHGAADPLVSNEERVAFEAEMESAGADWQLVAFGNTVHSFTNPDANQVGTSAYNMRSSDRAFAYMRSFFAELFAN